MNWQTFIKNLLETQLKLSPKEVENLTGIKQPVIDRWKNGAIGKPQRNTIRRLEEGLKIVIDDSDPENITYSKFEEKPKEPQKSKIQFDDDLVKVDIFAYVHAGSEGPIFSEEIIDTIYIRNEGFKNLKGAVVFGDSMEPLMSNGDYVVVSQEVKPGEGDVCMVAFNDHDYVLKRVFFNNDAGFITLVSENTKYPPSIVSKHEIKSIIRVVGLYKGPNSLKFRG